MLSVHNAGYQGHFGQATLAELGLPAELWHWQKMEWYGQLNILKGGLVFSDAVATVSPTHAHELRTPAGGFGLHDAFIALKDRLVGILNGINLRGVGSLHRSRDPRPLLARRPGGQGGLQGRAAAGARAWPRIPRCRCSG